MKILLSGGFNQLFDCLSVYPYLSEYVGMFKTPLSGYSFKRMEQYDFDVGLDNGCYAGFDKKKYLKMLAEAKQTTANILWVTIPDVVGDARATQFQFEEWITELHGLKLAYVGQDGAEDLDLPFAHFDCLFIGGTTEWKLSQAARDLILYAKHTLKKSVHVGRVNSEKRLSYCYQLGVDTVDGSGYFRYKWWYLSRTLMFLDGIHRQCTFL